MQENSKRTALVTGSSRGIGKGIALALGAVGMNVVINCRQAEEKAQEVAREVRELGGKALVVTADVSRAGQVIQLVERAQQAFGPIEVLVNNAGIALPRKIEDLTEKDWDLTMNVNLKSAFLLTQAVLPSMREARWGRIVNISSTSAQTGGLVGPHYAASKAGMHGLTRSYAAQLVKKGITVNSVAASLIRTEMVVDNVDASINLPLPMKRMGEVKEVVDVVMMLIQNAYITGQTFNVNGGVYFS